LRAIPLDAPADSDALAEETTDAGEATDNSKERGSRERVCFADQPSNQARAQQQPAQKPAPKIRRSTPVQEPAPTESWFGLTEVHGGRVICSSDGLSSLLNEGGTLPGMSKKIAGAASTDMALLAQLLGSEQAGVARHRTNIGWRNKSKDMLSNVKSRKDERIIKEFNAVRAVAFRGQENRLSTLLQRLHYSSESVQWYLSSGLLLF
jgi:hypothetical protein